jgi:hypothetical protein
MLLAAGESGWFYELSAARSLTLQLQQVIDHEGPLPEPVLFRRVARAWGFERTGSRIVERLRNLLLDTSSRTIEDGVTYYWPSSVDVVNWSGFRLSNHDTASRRHITDVAIEEVGNLVLHVLEAGGAVPRSEAAKSVCRLIGMARTTVDAEARVERSIDILCAKGKIIDLGTSIRLPPN